MERAIAEVSIQEIPSILGDLERLKASGWARLTAPQIKVNNQTLEGEDQLLTVEEVAKKLGVPRDWIYRRTRKLPFTVRLGPRHVRFSLRGLERYIRQRQKSLDKLTNPP